jgi:hypothetical protein
MTLDSPFKTVSEQFRKVTAVCFYQYSGSGTFKWNDQVYECVGLMAIDDVNRLPLLTIIAYVLVTVYELFIKNRHFCGAILFPINIHEGIEQYCKARELYMSDCHKSNVRMSSCHGIKKNCNKYFVSPSDCK